MRWPHHQSHVTFWCRGYVTNNISTFTRPMDPNLAGWWFRMREAHPQATWHIKHVVMWQVKDVVSPLSQGLWIPKLARWGLRLKGPHPQSHVTHCQVITWQIKGVIFPLSQGLWTPNPAGWWLRMREPHPQVTWHIDTWSHDKSKTLYLHFLKAYGPQT